MSNIIKIYSRRPKSKRLDFGQDRFGSVVKQFRFWTHPITNQNCLVCQTQNQFQTCLNLFGTGSVRLSDVWDEPNDFKPNKILFGYSNQTFRFRMLTVFIYLFIYLCIHLYIYLSIYVSINLSNSKFSTFNFSFYFKLTQNFQ